jgi:hypothetical protein
MINFLLQKFFGGCEVARDTLLETPPPPPVKEKPSLILNSPKYTKNLDVLRNLKFVETHDDSPPAFVSEKFGVLRPFKPKEKSAKKNTIVESVKRYHFYQKFLGLKDILPEHWTELKQSALELYVNGIIRDQKTKKVISKDDVKMKETELLRKLERQNQIETPGGTMKLTFSHFVIYQACETKNINVIKKEIIDVFERRQSNILSQKKIRERGHKYVPSLNPRKKGRPSKKNIS